MKRQLKKQLISGVAIALAVGLGSMGNARTVSAQSLDNIFGLVSLPLSLFNQQSKQPVNRNISGFSGNLNSNNFNLCVLPSCSIPNTFSSPQTTSPMVPGGFNGAVRPGMPVAPVQPTPPRPTLVLPPIKLPINLPL